MNTPTNSEALPPTTGSASSRTSVIAKLAYWHGGHNASENQWGRLSMMVDVEDDEAVAEYLFKAISNDARKPLEAEIIRLKALLFDSENSADMTN